MLLIHFPRPGFHESLQGVQLVRPAESRNFPKGSASIGDGFSHCIPAMVSRIGLASVVLLLFELTWREAASSGSVGLMPDVLVKYGTR